MFLHAHHEDWCKTRPFECLMHACGTPACSQHMRTETGVRVGGQVRSFMPRSPNAQAKLLVLQAKSSPLSTVQIQDKFVRVLERRVAF